MTILEKIRRKNPAAKKLSAPGMIGLDITDRNIHLCQIRPLAHGQFSIFAKASIGYDGGRASLLKTPGKLKALLNPVLKKHRFRGKRVAAVMPWEEARVILLTYKAGIRDVEGEILKMLARRIEGQVEDYIVDYVPVRSNSADEEHMVMVTIARRDNVNNLVQALIGCGFEVDSLDIGPTALRRVVSALYTGEAADNVLMINTYQEESYLTVVSGRRLLFNQAVPFGENLLIEQIASNLDVSNESARALIKEHGLLQPEVGDGSAGEAEGDIAATLLEIVKPCFIDLVNEINRVLVFTASETHGVPVSRICLFGSMAAWPGAREELFTLLDFNPQGKQTEFNQIFIDENDDTHLPWEGLFSEISIAMGLALRGQVANE